MKIATIGIDIAKHIFQVHGVGWRKFSCRSGCAVQKYSVFRPTRTMPRLAWKRAERPILGRASWRLWAIA